MQKEMREQLLLIRDFASDPFPNSPIIFNSVHILLCLSLLPQIPSRRRELQPNSQSLTGRYSRLWHRTVVRARQPMYPGGRQSSAIVDYIRRSGTKNLATGLAHFLHYTGNQVMSFPERSISRDPPPFHPPPISPLSTLFLHSPSNPINPTLFKNMLKH